MSLVLNVEILGEFKKLTSATKGAESNLQKLNKTTSSISRTMSGALAAVGVGFSLNAVVNGVKDAINAASDLEQQYGGLDSVFGSLAPVMKVFAQNASAIGLSNAEAAKQTTLLGAQLKGYGLPVQQAADQTKKLTLLAADLAATFGGKTSDAVASIGSLFRGEFDPIEKYGVAIKQSDVNARLAADGLDKLTGEALKQASAQAALALLFEKTADAQGASARESETYAAQSAELTAQFENMKAEVGAALLPIMVELFQEIRANIPEIKKFVAEFIEGTKAVGEFVLQMIRNKEQLLPVALAIGGVTAALKVVTVAFGAYNAIATAVIARNAAVVASNGAVAASNTAVATTATAAATAMRALAALSVAGAVLSLGGSAALPGTVPSTMPKPADLPNTPVVPPQQGTGIPGFGAAIIPKPVTTGKNTVPTVKPTATPKPTVVINNNVNVKNTTASPKQIVSSLQSLQSSTGVSIARLLK
jgi:hypothetical protein